MTDAPEPILVALQVARVLDALAITYTIGGSIASSFAGEPRSTVDVDFVVELREEHISALAALLEQDFYLDAEALRRAARDRGCANLIHQATSIKVDLFVAGGTPLDRQQLGRRKRVPLGPDQVLFIHPPEDILLQKLRWFRMGGEVSDRQWRDIKGIVRVQGGRLDLDYLGANAPVLGVGDLLERALEDS